MKGRGDEEEGRWRGGALDGEEGLGSNFSNSSLVLHLHKKTSFKFEHEEVEKATNVVCGRPQ